MGGTVRVNKGQYGKDIVFTVTNPNSGDARNISDANVTRKIYVGRSGEDTGNYIVNGDDLSFTSDGTDGQLSWNPDDGDLDVAGYYDVRIELVGSGFEESHLFTLQIIDSV